MSNVFKYFFHPGRVWNAVQNGSERVAKPLGVMFLSTRSAVVVCGGHPSSFILPTAFRYITLFILPSFVDLELYLMLSVSSTIQTCLHYFDITLVKFNYSVTFCFVTINI